jgi:hypothetical protein
MKFLKRLLVFPYAIFYVNFLSVLWVINKYVNIPEIVRAPIKWAEK